MGRNLIEAKAFPVVLAEARKARLSRPMNTAPRYLVQKWFTAPEFPGNLAGIWDKFFGYLHKGGQSHLLVGEFGIRDTAAAQGKAGVWFDEFLKYMGKDYSWTFWCLNPNSGDTGGLLTHDWLKVEQWKLDKLKPYMAPPIGRPEVGIRPIPPGRFAERGEPGAGGGRSRCERQGASVRPDPGSPLPPETRPLGRSKTAGNPPSNRTGTRRSR